jgi:hypothetical protein
MTRTYRSEPRATPPPHPDAPAPSHAADGTVTAKDVTAKDVTAKDVATKDTVSDGAVGGETAADAGRAPTAHLVAEVATDVSTLFRQEVALAKAELREEAGKVGRGMGMFVGAGAAGFFAALFVLLAAMFGLAEVLERGWAALIVAAVLAVTAAVFAVVGRRTVRTVHPTPTRTVATLREDVQWAQGRRR